MWLYFSILLFITIFFERCASTFNYYHYDGSWTLLPLNGSIVDESWNCSANVKVLIHGYNHKVKAVERDVIDAHYITILAQEYSNYDCELNIIVVDWKSLATFPLHKYSSAVKNVKPAGKIIAKYLYKLVEAGSIEDWDKIHILGLSLGAHVAGAVGYEIQELTGGEKVARITGLDPAGPGFTTWNGKWPDDMTVQLDSSDATLVDIIHTNMGRALQPILAGALGTDLQTGHIDFYPNGGKAQKIQCNFLKERIEFCSHQMSVLFYAQALREPLNYTGCPCENYHIFLKGHCPCTYNDTGRLMGELTTEPDLHGRFYMTIKDPISTDTFAE